QVAVGLLLRDQVLGAVLAHERDPGLGQHRQLLGRDVLGGGAQGDGVHVSPGGRDPLADTLEVVAHCGGAQAAEGQALSHAMPPWRPVTPSSRRWEKNRSALQLVHRSTCWTCATPAARSCASAIARRSSMRPFATLSWPANASSTSWPTS